MANRRTISWRSLSALPRWIFRSGGTILRPQNIPWRQSAEDDEKRQFMFDSIVAATSLQEILLEQMRESRLTDQEKAIGELLIGNIDDHGYEEDHAGGTDPDDEPSAGKD